MTACESITDVLAGGQGDVRVASPDPDHVTFVVRYRPKGSATLQPFVTVHCVRDD